MMVDAGEWASGVYELRMSNAIASQKIIRQ